MKRLGDLPPELLAAMARVESQLAERWKVEQEPTYACRDCLDTGYMLSQRPGPDGTLLTFGQACVWCDKGFAIAERERRELEEKRAAKDRWRSGNRANRRRESNL